MIGQSVQTTYKVRGCERLQVRRIDKSVIWLRNVGRGYTDETLIFIQFFDPRYKPSSIFNVCWNENYDICYSVHVPSVRERRVSCRGHYHSCDLLQHRLSTCLCPQAGRVYM